MNSSDRTGAVAGAVVLIFVTVFGLWHFAGVLTIGTQLRDFGVSLNHIRHLQDVPLVTWVLFGVFMVLVATLAIVLASKVKRRFQGHHTRTANTVWATPGDLPMLMGKKVDQDTRRVRLGTLSGKTIYGEPLSSTLVLAPSRSGKTASFVVPCVLRHVGPSLVTSVKSDVLELTRSTRSQKGPVWVFDPCQTVGETVRWSPLATIHTWGDALRATSWFQVASKAKGSGDGVSDKAFWDTLARQELAPLLYLAARKGLPMSAVTNWAANVDSIETQLAEEIAALDEPDASQLWNAFMSTEHRTKSSISATTYQVLEPWRHPAVKEAVTIAPNDTDNVFQIADLFTQAGTLYLVAPASEQADFAPVFTALTNAVVSEAERLAAGAGGIPIDPPLLLCLDEAANIAPLENLGGIASAGAGQGIILVSVWQDLAQIDKTYGTSNAATIVSNHINKLFLPGISDQRTLELVSLIIGTALVARSTTSQGDRNTSVSTAYQEIKVAPPSFIRELATGKGILITGNKKPAVLDMVPYYRDRAIRDLMDPVVLKHYDDYWKNR